MKQSRINHSRILSTFLIFLLISTLLSATVHASGANYDLNSSVDIMFQNPRPEPKTTPEPELTQTDIAVPIKETLLKSELPDGHYQIRDVLINAGGIGSRDLCFTPTIDPSIDTKVDHGNFIYDEDYLAGGASFTAQDLIKDDADNLTLPIELRALFFFHEISLNPAKHLDFTGAKADIALEIRKGEIVITGIKLIGANLSNAIVRVESNPFYGSGVAICDMAEAKVAVNFSNFPEVWLEAGKSYRLPVAVLSGDVVICLASPFLLD